MDISREAFKRSSRRSENKKAQNLRLREQPNQNITQKEN
nr:MAG TPA: hypothetical protein [Caudoviricetes sp.]